MKTLITAIFCLMIFSSCDRRNFIYYTVDNKTKDQISINYYFRTSYMGGQKTDSVSIMPGLVDTLFTFNQTSPSVYNPESEDKMINIQVIRVMTNKDLAVIEKDFNSRDKWIINKTDGTTAVYTLIIDK